MMDGPLQTTIFVVLLITISVAGCIEQPESTYNLSYHGGNATVKDGQFRMTGTISADEIDDGDEVDGFSNISVTLYDGDGNKRKSFVFGDISFTDDETNSLEVDISSVIIPKYVIIESPNLWENPDVDYETSGMVRVGDSGTYRPYEIERPDGKFNTSN